MRRRSFLKMAAAIPIIVGPDGQGFLALENISEERKRQAAKWRAEALEAFPYERMEVSGSTALQEWERLKSAKRGSPVVIGSSEAFDLLLEIFHPDYWTRAEEPVPMETLAKADRLTHPDSLLAYLELEEERLQRIQQQMCSDDPQICAAFEAFQEQARDLGIHTSSDYEPPVGRWPKQPPHPPALTVVENRRTGQPFDSVSIVLIPDEDWTTIPAYLRWGNWNANPPPEYHVAALRSWRDRYGAELIGMSFDVMNIRVATKPNSRDEAMALAREHYAYCNDLIDQGLGTLSNLAAALKSHDWWYFWWD